MQAAELRTGRATIEDLTVTDADVEAVVARLRQHGVVVLPNWLGAAHVEGLQTEFSTSFATIDREPEELTDTGKDLSRFYGRTTTGEHLKYGNAKLIDMLPISHKVFNDPFMRAVANGYLGTPNTLNRHVILTDDYRTGDEIISYHFDEIRSLKFLIYLDDVDESNGPFSIIPGTHAQGEQIRVSEWLRTGDFNALKIRVFESFSEDVFYTLFGHFKPFIAARAVSVHAPAGTLIVFNTDTIHRAGRLAEGRRRRVIRGSSYSGIWP